MIKSLAKKMVETFIEKAIIEKEEFRIYSYGCELFISEVISTMILIIMSIIIGKFVETILYLITFTSIRVYAGGYHSNSYKKCICIFNICSLFIIMMIEWMFVMRILDLVLLLLLVADIIIFVLAPVEDQNKRLEQKEFIKYRKIARKFLYIFYFPYGQMKFPMLL